MKEDESKKRRKKRTDKTTLASNYISLDIYNSNCQKKKTTTKNR